VPPFGPLAEMDGAAWGWVGAVSTLLGALSVAVVSLMNARHKAKMELQAAQHEAELVRAKTEREDRTGTIAEWREIANDLQARFEASDKGWRERLDCCEKNWRGQRDEVQKQVMTLMEARADCEKRVAQHEGEIRLLQATMQRVQEHTGTVPLPALPGLLVADVNGVMQVMSPAAAAMFDCLPADLEGQDVGTVIPELKAALAALRESGQPPWTERAILGEGRRKGGGTFPVAVNLRGWQSPGGGWLVKAEIRQRPAASAGPGPENYRG
jgi:PAS domain-containing protein